jgi:hypothetical protein
MIMRPTPYLDVVLVKNVTQFCFIQLLNFSAWFQAAQNVVVVVVVVVVVETIQEVQSCCSCKWSV